MVGCKLPHCLSGRKFISDNLLIVVTLVVDRSPKERESAEGVSLARIEFERVKPVFGCTHTSSEGAPRATLLSARKGNAIPQHAWYVPPGVFQLHLMFRLPDNLHGLMQ